MRFDHLLAAFPRHRFGCGRRRMPALELWLLGLGLVVLGAGCAPPDTPEDEEPDVETGMTLIEGSAEYSTNAVSFRDSASGLGYALATVAVNASTNGPAYFIYQADFSLSCNPSDCWPNVHEIYVQAGLKIHDLSWSPQPRLPHFAPATDSRSKQRSGRPACRRACGANCNIGPCPLCVRPSLLLHDRPSDTIAPASFIKGGLL